MPILSGNVKLLKSANMAGALAGGGAPTGLQITDSVSIFPAVSELDRAGGLSAMCAHLSCRLFSR